MKRLRNLTIHFYCLLALLSCTETSSQKEGNANNSIYYWRTTLSLNETEREFMKEHDITKLYIRFFDVDYEYETGEVSPKATVQFQDSIPAGIEVIPTIYITTNAIEKMQLKEADYAEKIFKRVNAMCRHNGIGLKELQLDCDWTKRTRKFFYNLCEEMKSLMDSTQILSSTIRLHQLTQTPPPVDRGVLMVYNTGNLQEISTDNSIFSPQDIKPYLLDNRLADYALHLDVAYPVYGWSLVFHPEEDKFCFDRILHCTDFSSYLNFKRINKNTYEAINDINLSTDSDRTNYIYEGDRIRIERPNIKTILEIKDLIEKQLADKPHNTILYHLDESQLSHHSDNEINEIYSRN